MVCVTPWAEDPVSTTGLSQSAQLSLARRQPAPVAQGLQSWPPEVESPHLDFSPAHLGSVHHLKLLMLYPVSQQGITSALCRRVAFYSIQKGMVIKHLLHARDFARHWDAEMTDTPHSPCAHRAPQGRRAQVNNQQQIITNWANCYEGRKV